MTRQDAQHTPGPWSYNGRADHCDVGREYHEITGADGFEIINQNGVVTTEEDARLIAAAPELLAVAAYFDYAYNEADNDDLTALDDGEIIEIRVTGKALKDARAAIRKATESGS